MTLKRSDIRESIFSSSRFSASTSLLVGLVLTPPAPLPAWAWGTRWVRAWIGSSAGFSKTRSPTSRELSSRAARSRRRKCVDYKSFSKTKDVFGDEMLQEAAYDAVRRFMR